MGFGSKNFFMGIAMFCAFLAAGCATAPQRNYSGDIDSLNAKISSLQSELSAKDAEIAGLKNQMSGQEAALKAAEEEKRGLNEKLGALSKKETPKAYDSDLK